MREVSIGRSECDFVCLSDCVSVRLHLRARRCTLANTCTYCLSMEDKTAILSCANLRLPDIAEIGKTSSSRNNDASW